MSRPRDEGTLFVVFVSPSPAASTQTGSATNTFTLISFFYSSESGWRRRFVGPRDSDVCISSGRTTFDGARQSGHATDTPLRRVIDRSTSDLAYESEHEAHIAWEHSKTVASAVSLS